MVLQSDVPEYFKLFQNIAVKLVDRFVFFFSDKLASQNNGVKSGQEPTPLELFSYVELRYGEITKLHNLHTSPSRCWKEQALSNKIKRKDRDFTNVPNLIC